MDAAQKKEAKLPRMFRKPDPLPQRRHLLLIGAPRSGTTLLATMIGRHTEVGMVNEDVTGRGIRKVLGKQISGNKLCVPNQIRLGHRHFFAATALKKLGIVAEAPKSKYSIRDYLDLPNLKLIAIIRGAGSISSMRVRGQHKPRKAVRRWAEAIETIEKIKHQYGERVLVVNFEDLLLEPEPVLRRVCEFLNLGFQEPMLHGYEHNPYYPGSRLDTEKARPEREDRVDSEIAILAPSAYKKYQELSEEARGILVNR